MAGYLADGTLHAPSTKDAAHVFYRYSYIRTHTLSLSLWTTPQKKSLADTPLGSLLVKPQSHSLHKHSLHGICTANVYRLLGVVLATRVEDDTHVALDITQ
eukprot:scpid18996/ scgid29638/ 